MEAITETPIFAPLFNRKHLKFGLWCNGSTTGFGSVCPGSNPGSPTTNRQKPQEISSWGFFFFRHARKRCIRMYETDTTTFNLSIYNYANRQYYKAICMRYSDIVTHKVFYCIKQLTLWKKQYLCVAFKTSLNLYIDSCI